jgi:alkylation response protein AidB-like acyl-CoA dehydrogenase
VSPQSEEDFRAEARSWLAASLAGEFASLVRTGGQGRDEEFIDERKRWERRLGDGGWIGLGWPVEEGGRGLPMARQVVFLEEYARARAPARLGHVGEQLIGPTLLAFGTPQQKARFLPGILHGTDFWCQGYSEPEAGSDLAAVRTRAELKNGAWYLHGQKVWTSHAHLADWCFVLARTDPEAERHKGLSYLLVPMRQDGVEVRPIRQITGTAEFSEVFFDGARAHRDDVVGQVNGGWQVAMGTLEFERGVAMYGLLMQFEWQLDNVLAMAQATGAMDDPLISADAVEAWMGLQVLKCTMYSTLGDTMRAPTASANIVKLLWSLWHQRLGELAVEIAGAAAVVTGPGYALSDEQMLFLYSLADTIYGGSSEIQRNVIAERRLGLPRG